MGRPSKEFQAFDRLTKRLLEVPRDVVQKRIEQHREQVAKKPTRLNPGPNRKPKPSSSDPVSE